MSGYKYGAKLNRAAGPAEQKIEGKHVPNPSLGMTLFTPVLCGRIQHFLVSALSPFTGMPGPLVIVEEDEDSACRLGFIGLRKLFVF